MSKADALRQIVLQHLDGDRRGTDVSFQQLTLTVGRADDCDLVFAGEKSTSTHHAMIRQREGQVEIVDTGSVSGTFVNDARVSRAALKDGDSIRFGALGPLVRVRFMEMAESLSTLHTSTDTAAIDSERSMRFLRNAGVLYLGGAVAAVSAWDIVVERYDLAVHWFSVFLVWLCGGFASTMLEAWYRSRPGAQKIVWWEVAIHAGVLLLCCMLTWFFIASS
jgi:hypothetical protein